MESGTEWSITVHDLHDIVKLPFFTPFPPGLRPLWAGGQTLFLVEDPASLMAGKEEGG